MRSDHDNKTRQRLLTVVENIREEISSCDEYDLDYWKDELEELLNNMQSEGFFGTKGQNDPRGDFRNHEWSMDRVQGIDK